MSNVQQSHVVAFEGAARQFCDWADSSEPEADGGTSSALRLVSRLFAAGCQLGWEESASPDVARPSREQLEAVRKNVSRIPFQYYSEIFNSLVVPSEAPVIGDIIDDLMDIYSDIAPGLALFEQGETQKAVEHWSFWLLHHWGEHATSAARALYCYVAGRKGSETLKAG